MTFALSTRWNTYRHLSGEALIEEILQLGFDRVELGYDLTVNLVPGIKSMVDRKCVAVETVHNYCPVPLGHPMGHPELFTFADPDARVREHAIWHTRKTVEFAAEMGARVVVAHMGNVRMRSLTRKLLDLWFKGRQFDERYEKTKIKLMMRREKKIKRQLEYLYRCLEDMIPFLERMQVRLAMENLPTWEAIPTENEIEKLLQHFNTPWLAYWHDIGHGQIRQNLGFINHARWLERLRPYLAGMHIHDVAPPAMDHLMPPQGKIDFTVFKPYVSGAIHRVFEPSRRVTREELVTGLQTVRNAWEPVEAHAPSSQASA